MNAEAQLSRLAAIRPPPPVRQIKAIRAGKLSRLPMPDRMWSRVDKDGPVARDELGPCWVWMGTRFENGYGRIMIGGKQLLVHRVAFEVANGRPPSPGMLVIHGCDNRLCVRHLREGSDADNVADAMSRGRMPKRSYAPKRLTREKALEIRGRDGTNAKLAEEYGVCPQTISSVRNGRTWAL